MYYVGIDWADQKHDFAVLDSEGQLVVKPRTIEKNYNGFETLLKTLRELSEEPQMFKVGLETSHNLIVDYLVDLGYPVYSVFPGLMKSFRQRFRVSGAHDDRFDAFVLADSLRTDKRCWHPVDFGSDLAREIRMVARDQHTLVQHRVKLVTSLRSTLNLYYPEYVHFFKDVSGKTSLAFIQAYPTFESARRLSPIQIEAFFKEHHYHNNKAAEQVHAILHGAHLNIPQPVLLAKQRKAVMLAEQLQHLIADLKHSTEHLVALVGQHPDGNLFMSHPAVAHVNAARLIAIFGDNRTLFTRAAILQALAGTCPVTDSTGGPQKRICYYRRACNKFNRDVMHQIAFASLRRCSWAKHYYQRLRKHGKRHHHALRCLANIHVKILFAVWRDKTAYDENVFLAQRARNTSLD